MDNKLVNDPKELSLEALDEVTGGVVVAQVQNIVNVPTVTPDTFGAMLPDMKDVPAAAGVKPEHPEKLVHPGKNAPI